MNKTQLAKAIAAEANTTQKNVDQILGAAINIIQEAVANGEKVTLIGFGTFEARNRQPRLGRNPQTGESLEIPAARVPAFSPGKAFKERVGL